MPHSRSRHALVALTLAAALSLSRTVTAAPTIRAAGPAGAAARSTNSPQAGVWQWLRTIWAKVGCIIDPSGQCVSAAVSQPPNPQTDEGCVIDPGGIHCRPSSAQRDEGCILDPGGSHCQGR
jgi:hypothetical protein